MRHFTHTTVAAMLAVMTVSATARAAGAGDAGAAFERFKALAGVWHGANQDGNAITDTFSVVAKGSCVMQVTEFPDAHDEDTMITMYHLDGDRFILKHYCIAQNQPQMLATSIAGDARTVAFTFDGGTNMPSRDMGHMDSATFEFIDGDNFKSRWQWYQDGQATWMEQFTYKRAGAAGPTSRPAQPASTGSGVEALAWMAGAWAGAFGDRQIEEYWTPPNGRTLMGANRTVRGDETVAFEYLRIEQRDGNIYYLASPNGRDPATPFKLIESGPHRAVFSNPDHDFPQRIIYERGDDELHMRIEGEQNGETTGIDWKLNRVAPAS